MNKCLIFRLMKTKRFGLRLNEEVKNMLRELAKNSKRTESDYLRLLIEYANNRKIKL